MFNKKIVKTGIGLLLSLSLFSVGINSTVLAATKCKHSYVGKYCCSSVKGQGTHQFFDERTEVWKDCIRKDILRCYVYECEKCHEVKEGIGYTKEIFTHSNMLCPFYPQEY